jgi:HAD superfamily phosphoserine phosphatase-like hydrolase
MVLDKRILEKHFWKKSKRISPSKMKYRLIAFDLDGVLFQDKSFWRRMHQVYNTEKKGHALAEKYLKKNYPKLVREVIGKLWKDKPAIPYRNLIKKAKYNPGVKETFAKLKKMPIKTAIIAGSESSLVKRAKKELNIDYAFGNQLVIKKNKISGEFIPAHDFHGKGLTLKSLCKDLNIPLSQTIVVGDDENDLSKFKKAGLSIASNSTCQAKKKIASIIIQSNYLKRFLPHIS